LKKGDLCNVLRGTRSDGAFHRRTLDRVLIFFITLLVIPALLCASAGAQAIPSFAAASTAPSGQSQSRLSLSSMTSALQQAQNPLLGSVPQGKPTPGVLPLTAVDAIDRGLKYNLGLILSTQATEVTRGARWRALSEVLPNLNAHIAESVQQINLAAFGIPAPPGTPPIIGPFSVFDARVAATGPLLDLRALNLLRARTQDIKAAELDYQNTRDLIVLIVGGTYMQALAGEARIASAEAQVKSSQTLHQQAVDMRNAGMVAGIDVLRAQVELQVQQQRLLAARNDFSKQKLTLARLIGLPTGQEFSLAQQIPFELMPPLGLDQALERAYRDRPDYQSAKVQVQAAQLEKKAAISEALPSIECNADYGVLGKRPTQSHGTFTTAAALRIPIFQGGKVRGDVLQAQALLNRRQAELEDLRGRIEFEVRTAFLDLQSAADQVQVAKSSSDLAHQTLTQAQDRFRAGVTNNIEVVQAQEAIATTDENFIASTFSYNIAKLELARSLGIAERAVKDFLGGKP